MNTTVNQIRRALAPIAKVTTDHRKVIGDPDYIETSVEHRVIRLWVGAGEGNRTVDGASYEEFVKSCHKRCNEAASRLVEAGFQPYSPVDCWQGKIFTKLGALEIAKS